MWAWVIDDEAIWWAKYKAYLASPAWSAKKADVFAAAGHEPACHCCKRTDQKLSVHHIRYDRVGEEPLSDLMLVCHFCHKEIHNIAPCYGSVAERTELVRDRIEKRIIVIPATGPTKAKRPRKAA